MGYNISEEKKPFYPISGCCILTGEYITGITSSIGRVFTINIGRDDVNNKKLLYFQNNREILPTYAYDFLEWIAYRYEDIKQIICNILPFYRKNIKFKHSRYCEMYATFITTLEIMLMYACEKYHISVNISTKDFYLIDVYETFTSLVEKYDISPKLLKLEITETALMSDLDKNILIIKKLQDYGFDIEIDDFGSGYSSLNMLKDISADVLKIDMGFLRASENEVKGQDILESIIELANKLGMKVITEGVEKKSQLDMLSMMGCKMFQGYYFSKPIPVDEFEEKYKLGQE